jgi:hypothetical protein
MGNGKADAVLHRDPLVGRNYRRSNFLPISAEKKALTRFASEPGFEPASARTGLGGPIQDEILSTEFPDFIVLV